MASFVSALPKDAYGESAAATQMIRPRRLRKGQTVGLVSPASNTLENEQIRFAIEVVESLGFKVKQGKYLFERTQYFAGSDEQRAEDVNSMFADPSVDAIFALRGGYGSARILPFLDYDSMAKNPKVFMGYSDITAMLVAINKRCSMVTFHGPIAKQVYSKYTLAEFKKVLMFPEPNTLLAAVPPFEAGEGLADIENRLTRIYPGKARGQLLCGNLTLLVSLLGTPYEPDFQGKILVLEEVGEEPYRVDRMLTQLWLAGKLQAVAGIVFGKFVNCDSEGGNSFSLEEIFFNRCSPLRVPCIRGLMVGHVDDQTVLPLGMVAELDVAAGCLKLLEPGVI